RATESAGACLARPRRRRPVLDRGGLRHVHPAVLESRRRRWAARRRRKNDSRDDVEPARRQRDWPAAGGRWRDRDTLSDWRREGRVWARLPDRGRAVAHWWPQRRQLQLVGHLEHVLLDRSGAPARRGGAD